MQRSTAENSEKLVNLASICNALQAIFTEKIRDFIEFEIDSFPDLNIQCSFCRKIDCISEINGLRTALSKNNDPEELKYILRRGYSTWKGILLLEINIL